MRVSTALCLAMMVTASLSAATLTVDDDGPADFSDIRSAVAAAAPGDAIVVVDGLYQGPDNRNIDFGGKAITLTSANGPEQCIIDCQNLGRGLYFYQSEGAGTVVDGLTIMRGRDTYGGGIYCTNGASPTIRNCIIRDNYANYSGGGISCDYLTAPVIENCMIYANRSDSQGGGIACTQSNAAVIGCTFAENWSSSSGGGLYGYYGDLQVINCTFERNTAGYSAGAFYCYRSSSTVANCTFNDNHAASYGGAVYLGSQGTPVFSNCTFNANTSDNGGGGIYGSSSNTTVTLTHCVFTSHTAHAIYGYWGTGSSIRYCLFYDNQPADYYSWRDGTTRTGPAQINAASELNEGNLAGPPHFAFEGDLHLTAGSTCIDTGEATLGDLLAEVDFDGTPRPLDGNGDGQARVDIGAFEYNPDASVVALSQEAVEFSQEIDGPAPGPATFEVLNSGGSALDWQIDCNAPWLSVAPTSGASAGQASTVTLTANPAGLGQGIYQALVTVRDAAGLARPRTVLVSLRVKGTLHVPAQYGTIQAALDAAMDGETVLVGPGAYAGSLYLQRPVKLVGEGRPLLSSSSDTVVSVSADGSTVEGFEISGVNIGIAVYSSNNTIRDNVVTGAGRGIQLGSGSTGNLIAGNEVSECVYAGLYLAQSTGNTLRGNALHDNEVNFRVTGNSAAEYVNDIDTSNTVDGAALYYLVDEANVLIGPDVAAGCVYAIDCTNVTVSGQTLSHNSHGVLFLGTDRSRVENCVIRDNPEGGIVLQESANNTLMNNAVSACGYGIYLDRSGGNLLRSNAMTGNGYNFGCVGGSQTDYEQDIATSNRVDGKPVYYLVGLSQVAIDASSHAGCVYAVRCSSIVIRDLLCQGNSTGVTFAYTDDSTIQNVTAVGNEMAGIYLLASPGTTVAKCRVSDNQDGLRIDDCDNTLLDASTITYNRRGLWGVSGDLTMASCFVGGNGPDGGIYLDGNIQADLVNCTVYGNGGTQDTYPEPAGINVNYSNSVRLANTIVWANYPNQIGGYYPANAWYCDIQGGYNGEGNLDVDPMLTPDGHLRAGSPCILAGKSSRDLFTDHDIDGEGVSSRRGIDIGLDQFLDLDGDGLPDWWESTFFNNATMATPGDDSDGDTYTNITEYEVYASDPMRPSARYYVDAARPDDGGDGLSWETAKKTIQAAITLSDHSDEVYVAPGWYEENVTPNGRLIRLSGIDPQDAETVAETVISGGLTIGNGETPGCTVAGLTITNRSGVGLAILGASPAVRNCTVTNCYNTQYEEGAGVMLVGAAPSLVQCTISGNVVANMGAGLLARSSAATLRQCAIVGNIAQYGYGGDGSAIYAQDSQLTLECCTLADNQNPYQTTTSGSTIRCAQSDLSITNSILWNRPLVQVRSDESTVTVTYSDIRGGADAVQGLIHSAGNIEVDPHFVSAGDWDISPYYDSNARWIAGDYHLCSQGWRWVDSLTHGTHWVWDGQTSPCIDAGNPADGLDDELVTVPQDAIGQWGRNVRINMGAYGGTRQASMAPHDWAWRADINNDGVVNLLDLPYLGDAYRSQAPRRPADLTRDGRVDCADLTLMADEWLYTTIWAE